MRAVRQTVVSGAVGPLGARHYVPEEQGVHLPLLVFFHGGGYVLCDLDTHDAACRTLCRRAGIHVLSVDYRLAPSTPSPQLSLMSARLRGGHCATRKGWGRAPSGWRSAATARAPRSLPWQLERFPTGASRGRRPLLLYPGTDSTTTPYRSHEPFGHGFGLTLDEIDWFLRQYAGEHDRADPRISPLLADALFGLLPPSWSSPGSTLFRDQAQAYARALHAAGDTVRVLMFSGLIHGFANMVAVSPAARSALVEVAEQFRALLDRSGARVGGRAAVG